MKLLMHCPHIIIGVMQHQDSDTDVIRHIKKGDINWYAVLVQRYTTRIYQYVSSKLFDRGEADDIVQITLIHFYKALDRFDDQKPVLPYLYEIAKNELKMFFRSHKDMMSLNEQMTGTTAEEYLTDTELEDLLRGVSPDQQKALRMLYEGYSYQEIAEVLRRPINTIRTLIRRARRLLTIQNKHEKT